MLRKSESLEYRSVLSACVFCFNLLSKIRNLTMNCSSPRILLLSMASVGLTKYSCRQYNPGHITCQARNPRCQITDDHYLSYAERHEILEAHNQIRREAAKGLLRRFGLPEAANMKKMVGITSFSSLFRRLPIGVS